MPSIRVTRCRAAAVFLALLPGSLSGQVCDSLRAAAPADSLPYEPRGQRCEGFYRAEVAGPVLEVVGAMRGRLHFDTVPGERVELSPAVAAPDSLHVRVLPFPVKTYYQMDAWLGPGDSLAWPLDVVRAARLLPDQLAVGAWYRVGDRQVYVPVRASPTLATPLADDQVRLLLRANVALEYIQYIWVDGQVEHESEVDPKTVPAGRPIAVSLPGDLDGVVLITVHGRIRGRSDRWVSRTVAVLMGPS